MAAKTDILTVRDGHRATKTPTAGKNPRRGKRGSKRGGKRY